LTSSGSSLCHPSTKWVEHIILFLFGNQCALFTVFIQIPSLSLPQILGEAKQTGTKELHRTNMIVKRSLLQVINLPPPLPTHHYLKKKCIPEM
jgi:hypothetical protein